MIMPCMNATSAWESGGSMARVEDGSILLGLPGAPGCTTAGFVESDCCECATTQKNPVEASSKLQNIFRIDEKYVRDSTRCSCPASIKASSPHEVPGRFGGRF